MARSKHSTALFEVIHSGRGLERRDSSGGFRAPRWWFKSGPKAPMPIVRDVFDNFDEPEMLPEPVVPARAAVATDEPAAVAALETKLETAPDEQTETRGGIPLAEMPHSRSTLDWKVDRERHEVTVRVQYTTAIIAGFAVLVLIGMAYMMGRHRPASQQATHVAGPMDDLINSPAAPSALDVPARGSLKPKSSSTGGSTVAARPAPRENHPVTPQMDDGPNVGRVIGTNYIIAQSYPTEQRAKEARDLLLGAGIDCTVEKTPPGWRADSGWYSVITTTGFQHIKSPECEAYVHSIQSLNDKLPPKSGLPRFEPHSYKWKQS